jgi:SAM-dependent methyltransferase
MSTKLTTAHPADEKSTTVTGWGYEETGRHVSAQLGLRHRAHTETLDVLEAGGGSAGHVPLPNNVRITTIDISAEQIARNTYANEALVGDLQTFDYGNRRFDLIICWDVMEHLQTPMAAMERFAGILKPGGQILIVGPLPNTLKGLITKYTPHAVHVAFYRHALGSTTAGQPGHAPFPTEHADGADPRDMARALEARGIEIADLTLFESIHVDKLRDMSSILYAGYRAAEWLLSVLSLGHFAHRATDFVLVARKPK